MLWCWMSRNNKQRWGLVTVQRTHMGCNYQISIYLLLSFFFFFLIVKYMREATPYVKKGSPVSEIGWETPPPESPRLGCASADPLSQLSLSIHRDKKTIPLKMCYVTRNMTVSDPENRWAKDLPRAGILPSRWIVADLFSVGVGEEEVAMGSGCTQQPSEAQARTSLGSVGGGVWATWCWVQLLGCARETLQCGSPTFLLEIESQGFVFILIKCLLLKEKTLYTLIDYIFWAGLI